ncbi:MAG TPA: HEPN domain-containing protein [Puia sp.]|uniref:HEPN domain-containing protein n=1 Tax=Puia sp. TaxID=2045100 RepID=UPI002C2C3E4D|nr:HEPN domain-containing protein [Puia sp.]HVU93701.1 HEPN domain-containing protein [Puia sp.]
MISASSARLLSFSSGLRLQLMISTQFKTEECLAWGRSLEPILKKDVSLPDITPILERLLTEPEFALDDLRHNTIASGIVGYTSSIEYYLQDIIELCLKRNSGLRKKGLSGIQLPALELEHYSDTKSIKSKLIKSLSSENSKGALFSNKFKKISSFLSLRDALVDADVIKSLDSLWSMRNKFAHENQATLKSYSIYSTAGEISLSRQVSAEEYTKFIFELVKIIDRSNDSLFIVDQMALQKWSADKFE